MVLDELEIEISQESAPGTFAQRHLHLKFQSYCELQIEITVLL